MKPGGLHQSGIQKDHDQSADGHDDARRNGDDVPQPPGHEDILFPKNLFLVLGKGIRVFVIHEKPDQVKNPRKITDHKNDVQRLDDGIKHPENLSAKIRYFTKKEGSGIKNAGQTHQILNH